jgi:salicylate hydroxylase
MESVIDEDTIPSYPTNSLNFLKPLQDGRHNDTKQAYGNHSTPQIGRNGHVSLASKQPPIKLNVLIVGAGLGGLATAIALSRHGHNVTILESAPALGEVGAGIQIPPNSMRILLEWGLGSFLEGKAVEPDGMTFRRWQDGRPIAFTRLIPDHKEKFGAPYYVVHRADFHSAMHSLAVEMGVQIKVGHHVVDYHESDPSVTLADGRKMTADLIVAADGVKSIARKHIPGLQNIEPQKTPFAAYRATVDVVTMRKDPDTAWLVKEGEPTLNLWIGEGRHVMTYTIASGKSFNMVLSHRDASDPGTWPTEPEECLAQMRSYYVDWDPRLVKITKMIEKTMKWPLMTVPTSPRWLSESKRLLILGDAAHGMLPYMSQGAAMAVEDGAALAEVLSFAGTASQMDACLAVWQDVRVMRSSQMQQASAINGMIWHFGDGREQEARDESMAQEVGGGDVHESANQWTDPVTAQWAYGYDACEEIRRRLKSHET